jgi:hypothetical protein
LTEEEFGQLIDKPTAHLTEYVNLIKKVLSTREHVAR